MSISALAVDERAVDVEVSEDELSVRLMDGRTISVPLAWFPRLLHATESQRANWQIIGGGYGIHWPDIDEDLSTEGFLRGAPTTPRLAVVSRRQRSATPMQELPDAGAESESESDEAFDLLVEGEDAAHALNAQIEMLGELTDKIAAQLNHHSSNLERLNSAKGAKKFGEINKINLLAASDINNYSKWLEELSPEMEKAVERQNRSYLTFFQRLNPEKIQDWEGVRRDREALNNLLQTMTSAMQSVRNFRRQAESLQGISKHLNRAARRLISALDSTITNLTHIESFCLRCMQVIDEKMGGAK